MKQYQFWFVVGSQHLYGPEVLQTVAQRAGEMAEWVTNQIQAPCTLLYKATVKSPEEVTSVIKQANFDGSCLGIVTWCHTFSPSKMWINGLSLLQKPLCHFATQYNRNIPNDEIDMDFMNLNQAAHGDREHGFIETRMRMPRKVIMGYWQDEAPLEELGKWMRSAVGVHESRQLKVVRFGDNMRQVAVTEGDKVEAQLKLGWQVNTWAVGQLVREINTVAGSEIDALMEEYRARYDFHTDNLAAVCYQARMEIAILRILDREGAKAFSNTFEDLYGMEQLPGLATQRIMEKGYGYGGEGDWKVSAMTRIIKKMCEGMGGGSAFMEDYTYNLAKNAEYSLGAHMLEVCPSLSAERPRIEVHPLGIGGKGDPARLVFEGKAGAGTVTSLIDIGGRLRLIVQDIEAFKPVIDMPNLPVARVMWRALPDIRTSTKLWILAGGAHHTVLSYDATPQMLEDWADMMGIEYVHIGSNTNAELFRQQLFLSDMAWKLR